MRICERRDYYYYYYYSQLVGNSCEKDPVVRYAIGVAKFKSSKAAQQIGGPPNWPALLVSRLPEAKNGHFSSSLFFSYTTTTTTTTTD